MFWAAGRWVIRGSFFFSGCGRLSTLLSWPSQPLLWLRLEERQELPSLLSVPSCEEGSAAFNVYSFHDMIVPDYKIMLDI